MDENRSRRLTIGYDLDGGGYAFVDPTAEALKPLACVMWVDPDPDYIPWISEACRGFGRFGFNEVESPIYVFAPNTGHFPATEWPETYRDGEAGRFFLIAHGHLSPSDHQCNCHGRLVAGFNTNTDVPLSDAIAWVMQGKVETDVPRLESVEHLYWQYDDTPGAKPHPKCERCEGNGYVESEGGEWALYGRVPESASPGCDETYIGDEHDGVYFQPFEHCGRWFTALWVDSDTAHDCSDLPTGGPFKDEAGARGYGEAEAKEWCLANEVRWE